MKPNTLLNVAFWAVCATFVVVLVLIWTNLRDISGKVQRQKVEIAAMQVRVDKQRGLVTEQAASLKAVQAKIQQADLELVTRKQALASTEGALAEQSHNLDLQRVHLAQTLDQVQRATVQLDRLSAAKDSVERSMQELVTKRGLTCQTTCGVKGPAPDPRRSGRPPYPLDETAPAGGSHGG